MEVSSGPFVSGAYHRRRVSPHPAGRRLRRARRGRPRPADVRSQLPRRTAARLHAPGQRRRGAGPGDRRPAAIRPDQRPDRCRGRVRGRCAPAARLPPDAPAAPPRRSLGRPSRTAAGASRSRSATAWTGSPSTTPRSTSGSWSSRANRSAPRPTSPIASRPGRRPSTPVRLLGRAGLVGRARDRHRRARPRRGRRAADDSAGLAGRSS